MIKAVLFDLDGTLVNSIDDLADSTNYALSLYGCPIHNTEAYKYFVGDGIPKLIERSLPEEARGTALYDGVYKAFVERYGAHFADKTVPYDGVESLLSRLTLDGIKIAVVSNKAQEMADGVIDKVLPHRFSAVFGKREGVPAKPNPAVIIKAAEAFGLTPGECLTVGDSGMDTAAAKNAGSVAVGVLWGFRDKAELIENGADYIVESPEEIIRIIKELNG